MTSRCTSLAQSLKLRMPCMKRHKITEKMTTTGEKLSLSCVAAQLKAAAALQRLSEDERGRGGGGRRLKTKTRGISDAHRERDRETEKERQREHTYTR